MCKRRALALRLAGCPVPGMRIILLFLMACALPLHAEKAPCREPDKTIRIWETGGWKGELPDGWKTEGPEKSDQQAHMGGTQAISNVSVPLLEYYAPKISPKSPGDPAPKSIIICPGGGYHILAWDLEGREIATWLSSQGVHAFVLKYRLPRAADKVRHAPALQDSQRSVSVVRSMAGELGLSADKIGSLGFSAGGHLAAITSCSWRTRTYTAADEIDKLSCRPDFSVLVYTAYLNKPDTVELDPQLKVDAETPPSLLIHAVDDPIPVQAPIAWTLALKAASVPVELHVYPDGGHGYGLRSDKSVKLWPRRVEEWLAGLENGKMESEK